MRKEAGEPLHSREPEYDVRVNDSSSRLWRMERTAVGMVKAIGLALSKWGSESYE